MYEKPMYTTRLHTYLSIRRHHLLGNAVDFNTHNSGFDAEVFGLELVEVQEGPFGAGGAVDEEAEG